MFEEVLGQSHAKGLLTTLLASGKIPHGILIYGPQRTGKFTLAMALAKAINCKQSGNAGCTCSSCFKVSNSCHPDVRVVKPNDRGNTTIDQIRQEIISPFEFKVHEGRQKVAVIQRADLMQQSAANALLKVLEEPRGQATIILTTNRYGSLLDTIRSRCQSVRLSFLTDEHLSSLLTRDGQEVDPILVELMGGSYDLHQIQDDLPILRYIFDGSDVELSDKIESDAVRNELRYLGGVFAYMSRSSLHAFGKVLVQRANSTKLGKLFQATDQALGFISRGVKPFLVVKWYEFKVREVIA